MVAVYPGPMPPAAALPTDPGPYGPTGRSAWMDVDWRAHLRFVEVAGRRVNVVDIGEGDPPIVFIHGLAGSWQNWLENIPHFVAAGHRVVAFDLPGFGASELPAEKVSIAGYGRLVDTLLDALGLGPAVLVGNSMGGFIGAEVAIQFPQRVEELVLVSSAGLTIEYQRDERILGLLRFSRRMLMAWGGFIGARSDAVARRPRTRDLLLGLVVAHPDRLPAPLVAEQMRGAGNPGFVDALDALTAYPIRSRLGEIDCPVLIVWGAEDRLVPVRDADEFERLIPDARKVVWPDTGHTAMLERPQAFNRLVEAFVDGARDLPGDARAARGGGRGGGSRRREGAARS
jgi:pimeloyl-ACP methyl ester carboxylesterase